MKLLGYKRPMELDLCDNYNTKIFKNESDAEKWLEKYKDAESGLDKKGTTGIPKMLCKRRYIVLSALGEKSVTIRSKGKLWSKGQLFQLYDQTTFLTVILTDLILRSDGKTEYHYKVA